MNKNIKLLMAAAIIGVPAAISATPQVETRGLYSTNPRGGVGKPATITIDGTTLGWDESMLIAQGVANDACVAFKGQHENCVTDCYSMYAAWDDENLYIAWQMVNPADTWWRPGDGPLTDYGRIGNVPLVLALSVKPDNQGLSGRMPSEPKGYIWNTPQLQFTEHVDYALYMSGEAGQGKPSIFNAVDAEGNSSYDAEGCRLFSSVGIAYKMAQDFLPSEMMVLVNPSDPSAAYGASSTFINILDDEMRKAYYGHTAGVKHDTKYDSFYEIKIPFSAIGIDRNYLETVGIGARIIATRGESGIDCLPHDPAMLDNVYGDYAHDTSTSHEKDDLDEITYQMASIGCKRAGTAPVEGPKAIVNTPDGYEFHSSTLPVSVILKDATSGTYSVDGGTPVPFTGTTTANIGSGLKPGESVSITVSATNGNQDDIVSATYTKGEIFDVPAGTAILKKPADWEDAYIYMYGDKSLKDKWPGVKMSDLDGNYFVKAIPAGLSSVNIVFNDGKEKDAMQYPTTGNVTLRKGQVCLYDGLFWREAEFTGNGEIIDPTPDPDPDPDPNPNPNPDPDPDPAPVGDVCLTAGETAIFFEAPADWDEAYLFLCSDGWGALTGSFPGTKCVKVTDNVFKYTVTESNPHWVIFSNGTSDGSQTKGDGGTQTYDLLYKANGYYTLGMSNGSAPTAVVAKSCLTLDPEVELNADKTAVYVTDGIAHIYSPVAATYTVTSANGMSFLVDAAAGVTALPGLQPGFYIIAGHKVIIR